MNKANRKLSDRTRFVLGIQKFCIKQTKKFNKLVKYLSAIVSDIFFTCVNKIAKPNQKIMWLINTRQLNVALKFAAISS